MAQLRVDYEGERYLIEWSADGLEISQLAAKGLKYKSMMESHEKEIVQALFVSDYDDRGGRDVSADLKESQNNIRTIVHRVKKGNSVPASLYKKLKNLYKIGEVLK